VYGDGWVGLAADTTGGERDWISGGQVDVAFADPDSAGARRNAVQEIRAKTAARTYYRMQPERPGDRVSINYTRADRIRITMRVRGDSTAVDAVHADGSVDGVQLQPATAQADSTRARRPTVVPPPGGRP
jgi:hypothetical protein